MKTHIYEVSKLAEGERKNACGQSQALFLQNFYQNTLQFYNAPTIL